MYKGLLFTNKPKAISIPPQFNYINKLLADQMIRVQYLQRVLTTVVAESNLLVQIIQSLPFKLSGDPIIDYRNAASAVVQIANTHNLVTDDSRGKLLQGAVLPFKAHEVILCVNRPFDLKAALKNWEEITPLRFISHPVMDTTFPIMVDRFDKDYLNKNTRSQPKDTVFAMELDIPALVFMLSCFATMDTKQNVRNFVSKWVMTNSLASFTDISFMNRHFHQILNPTERIKTVFTPKGYTLNLGLTQIDTAFKEVFIRMNKQNRDIATIFAEINLPFTKDNTDYLYAAHFLDGNRQSRWALDVAYMPYIRGLLAVDANQTTQMSEPIKRSLRRAFVQMQEGNYLDITTGFPEVIRYIDQQLAQCVKHC